MAAGIVAATGFGALAAVFVFSLVAFQHSTIDWANRELAARTELAAKHLEEPLRTQDMKAIHDFADECREKGYALAVSSPGGGRFFDSDPARDPARVFSASADCGEYRISLRLPVEAVLRPYNEALPLFVLAFLAGAAGMLFVFFAFYRQRARLRELERVERERREFIADFSHELKTPLTGILGAVEMLEGQAKGRDDASAVLCGMISKEAKRLNSLAQQILDLSRLEASGGRLPEASRADLVDRAVGQLVENAKRHAGCAPEEITVREEDRGGLHRWIVEDRGIGVPAELRERIFERFYRVDPARAAESGGAGLGLAIVRRIARNLGGDCVCEAASPRGARFVFSCRSSSSR